jgi:hypothetical protein
MYKAAFKNINDTLCKNVVRSSELDSIELALTYETDVLIAHFLVIY